jgi:acyl-CoA thioesterase FadM
MRTRAKSEIQNRGSWKLVHTSKYSHIFTRDQTILGKSVIDGNNHVNNSGYAGFIETIRQDQFLPSYGFSDNIFNEMGWQQIRRSSEFTYGRGLQEGEKTDITLEVYVEPRTFFHMVFDFYNSEGRPAAQVVTNDFFKRNIGGAWTLYSMPTPKFFVDGIRNV